MKLISKVAFFRNAGFPGKALVFLFVLLMASACTQELTSEEHLERAQTFIDKDELTSAVIELKNALAQNSENAEARFVLGSLYFDQGFSQGAEKELRRASASGAEDSAVLPLLSKVLLAQAKYNEVLGLSLDKLIAADSKATVFAAQGLSYLAEANTPLAAEKISLALTFQPQDPFVQVANARLLAAKGGYEGARGELEQVLAIDEGYAPAWSLLGDFERRAGNLEAALANYSTAIDNELNSLANVQKRADVLVRLRRFDEAQADVNLLKKRRPNNPNVNFLQGMIFYSQGQLQEAKDAFDLTQRYDEYHVPVLYYLAQVHLRLGNMAQAGRFAERYFSEVPNSVDGRKLLASIKAQQGELLQAEKLLLPITTSSVADFQAVDLLSRVLLRQRKYLEAVVLLERLKAEQPNNAQVYYRLGMAQYGLRDNSAVKSVEKSLELDPNLKEAYLFLVAYYKNKKDLKTAFTVAKRYGGQFPDSAAPDNLTARLYLLAGDEPAAKNGFTQALDKEPGEPLASLGLATLAIKDKDYALARQYYNAVLAKHEEHLLTLLQLANLEAIESNEQGMVGYLQRALNAHPQSITPKVMLARYFLISNQPQEAMSLFQGLDDTQNKNPKILENMGLAHLALQQFAQAKESFFALVEQKPNSYEAHFQLANALAGAGDKEGTKKELQETIRLRPGHVAARVALAKLSLNEGQEDAFKEQLLSLNKLVPDHPVVKRLNARSASLDGNTETSLKLFEEAFESSANAKDLMAVVELSSKMGDTQKSEVLLGDWLGENPDDISARLALAKVLDEQGQEEQLLNQLNSVLQKDNKNIVALNQLAWHFRESDPPKALEYAQRAASLAPNNSAIMDTYAVVLLKNDDLILAKRTIENILKENPANTAYQYHSILIDSAVGASDKATIQALQSLLAKSGGFSEKADAEALLRQLQGK